MNRTFIGFIALLCCSFGWAALNVSTSVSGSGITKISGSGITQIQRNLVLIDNVEYLTEANALQAGWSDVGAPTWAYNTPAPAPLQGLYSLRSAANTNSATTPVFYAGPTEVWIYFKWLPIALASDADIVDLRDSGNTAIGVTITARTTGALRITSGTSTDFNGAISAGTVYDVMVRYVLGSGSNAVIEVWLSSGGAAWGSSYPKSNGTATGIAQRIRFRGAASASNVFDKIRVGSLQFGNVPIL